MTVEAEKQNNNNNNNKMHICIASFDKNKGARQSKVNYNK
jgi:hypothetical protein